MKWKNDEDSYQESSGEEQHSKEILCEEDIEHEMDELKEEDDIECAVGKENDVYVVPSNRNTFGEDGSDKEIEEVD